MKTAIIALVLSLFCLTGLSRAQDTTSSGKSKSEVRSISGCLAPGSSANNFVLNASDGSTWDVKSDKVSLADHVGHTVIAKGTVSNVTMHNIKEEPRMRPLPLA